MVSLRALDGGSTVLLLAPFCTLPTMPLEADDGASNPKAADTGFLPARND
jgi:hypothetical protein